MQILPVELFVILPFLITTAWFIVAVAATLATVVVVYRDARKLVYPALGINPLLWAGFALILPVIGVLIYWLMNRSSLVTRESCL